MGEEGKRKQLVRRGRKIKLVEISCNVEKMEKKGKRWRCRRRFKKSNGTKTA